MDKYEFLYADKETHERINLKKYVQATTKEKKSLKSKNIKIHVLTNYLVIYIKKICLCHHAKYHCYRYIL